MLYGKLLQRRLAVSSFPPPRPPQVGGLMKRLDTGEGSYAAELEEDYSVYDALGAVMDAALANEARCEEFHTQFLKYDFLWRNDLQVGDGGLYQEAAVDVPQRYAARTVCWLPLGGMAGDMEGA